MTFFKYISTSNLGLVFNALICSFFIFIAIDFAPHDFANYYFGGTFIREGLFTSDIYFPHIFNHEISALGYENLFVSFAPNTPFLGALFFPLSFFSLATAKIISNIGSLLLFLYSLRNLIKTYRINPIYLWLLPLVFFIPLRNNFLFGQVYLVLFFLLTEGFLAYRKNKYLKMGLFWSFAILLKVFPVLLFGMLLFRKKYWGIIYLSAACIVLLCFSLVISGFEIWEFYFSSVLPKSGNGEIAGEFVQNYQSVFMFLKYVFPTNILAFSMLLFLFKLMLLVLAYFVSIREKSKLKVFAFWMLLTILLSPYGSTYTNLLILFPFLYFIKKAAFRKKNVGIIILILLITTIPISYFSNFEIPFSFPRMWLLLLLLFVLIKDNLFQINWKKSLLFILPVSFLYFFLFLPKNDMTKFESISSDHILSYDFTIKDGFLHYKFWDAKGEHLQTTEIQVTTIDTSNIYLIDNQIIYKNKQLTFGKDHKLKPAIINGQTLVYLSDIKKGIGFYSLLSSPININK